MKPDRTLIISVFIVASCGLAYELIIAALASYLLGDSILQFSSIIGLYLFAMGIGAHLTKYIRDEDALSRFIEIELLVGIIGTTQAAEALKILLGLPAENGVLRCYNALSGQWQHFAIPKNPACKVCGEHKKAEEAT